MLNFGTMRGSPIDTSTFSRGYGNTSKSSLTPVFAATSVSPLPLVRSSGLADTETFAVTGLGNHSDAKSSRFADSLFSDTGNSSEAAPPPGRQTFSHTSQSARAPIDTFA